MGRFSRFNRYKVLVGTPHADIKNYCLENYISTVKSLSYKNYDTLVVDNSTTNKNVKYFRKFGISTTHVKRKNKTTRQLIYESIEVLRNATLKGGYDFLLMYESDLTPPINIIEQLLSHRKNVVSAAYFIGQEDKSHLIIQEMEKDYLPNTATINIKNGFDNYNANGKLMRVFACGTGMMLIHKSVLELIPFRYDDNLDLHPDTFFANDLKQANIPQYLDTSIICKHDNMDWNKIENK